RPGKSRVKDRLGLWGAASEHNVLYQYQFSNAKEVFLSMIQTETPYFQPVPGSGALRPGRLPQRPDVRRLRPLVQEMRHVLGRPIIGSSDIFIYSAGLYS
ncbi:hypothetical protein BGZ61DRAFT_153462, partial [Ilyonectria robusta]|uniref:uncharacterized protein n=1 Tax=Ilyonectria robusta TaxID=1079257 RepID=UPI001E8CF01A